MNKPIQNKENYINSFKIGVCGNMINNLSDEYKHCQTLFEPFMLLKSIELDLDERELSKPEKSKMKKYEKKVPKEEFIKRYGKDKGEMVYYGTLTNMAKDNA